MIYATSTITGPVAYESVCIYILCLRLPFIFNEECKEMGYLAKTCFRELRKWKIPDFGTGSACMMLLSPVAVLLLGSF